MNSFLAIVLVSLASAVSAEITCEECLSFTGSMGEYLMSEESLAEQTAIIIDAVCPSAQEHAHCEEGLNMYWSGIGIAMYPVFLEANAVCGLLGSCAAKSVLAEPTCEECTGAVDAVAGVIESAEKIDEIVAFLQGDDFCGPLGGTCEKDIEKLMPEAMPVLAEVLRAKASEFCCNFSDTGLCC